MDLPPRPKKSGSYREAVVTGGSTVLEVYSKLLIYNVDASCTSSCSFINRQADFVEIIKHSHK